MGLFRGRSFHAVAELSLGSAKWLCAPLAQSQHKDSLVGAQLGGILILPRFYPSLQGTVFCFFFFPPSMDFLATQYHYTQIFLNVYLLVVGVLC